MPAPLVAAAAAYTQKRGLRRVTALAAAGAPVMLIGLLVMTLLLATSLVGVPSSSVSRSEATCVANRTDAAFSGLDADQTAHARVIVAVGRGLQVSARGWTIAIATALTESGLRNLDYGDRESVGLFQQRAPWGPLEVRMDPTQSATMFYTGGRGGQQGLLQIPGWESMPLTMAAQAVQRSAFPTAYARYEALADELVADSSITAATCLTGSEYAGDGSAGARAVAAAMRWIGTPYSWGGGGINGPTLGFGSGAGTVGFDCSSLVQYAWHEATGIVLPRTTDDQVTALDPVPAGQPLRPGDLIYLRQGADPPGVYYHVVMVIDDTQVIHAPRPSRTVEVINLAVVTSQSEWSAWRTRS